MSLLVIGAVKGLGIVMPEVSVSAETSIAEGGAIFCFDSVRGVIAKPLSGDRSFQSSLFVSSLCWVVDGSVDAGEVGLEI